MVANELQGLKALIVDDYSDSVMLVRKILQLKGIESNCATTTSEALATYKLHQPDILLIDLEMPVEDGFSLIRKIRALDVEEGRVVPAIALTVHSLGEVKTKAREAGFQETIAKPFKIDALLAIITKALEFDSLSSSAVVKAP